MAGVITFFNNRPRPTHSKTPDYQQEAPAQPAAVSSVDTSDATEYYTDQLGWITDKAALLSGMKSFYEQTGVKPFLYLTDTVNGSHEPTDEELNAFTNELYDQLFTDENHFLLVFMEYGDYYMDCYVCGSNAADVIGEDGAEIVLDYIDRYYTSDMEDEEYFSTVFSGSASEIMRTR